MAKRKTAAKIADAEPCPSCGHCPTCGHSPKEAVKHVPVPMPYPVYPVAPAPPVYPWGWQRRPYIGTPYVYGRGGVFTSGGVYRNATTNVTADQGGYLVNSN